MSRCKGAAKIPLHYVYRPILAVDAAAIAAAYDNHEDQYHQCVVHEGAHYLADNKRVFGILKSCTLEGPAWRFIQQFD